MCPSQAAFLGCVLRDTVVTQLFMGSMLEMNTCAGRESKGGLRQGRQMGTQEPDLVSPCLFFGLQELSPYPPISIYHGCDQPGKQVTLGKGIPERPDS